VTARYVVAPVALDDIASAVNFIAANSPTTARQFVDELFDTFQWLGTHPHSGHARPDLTKLPVFFWTVFKRHYAIIYRKAEPLEIVRVLAWRQNLVTLLRDESDRSGS
jgi:plasmid stabilization system protein ParE